MPPDTDMTQSGMHHQGNIFASLIFSKKKKKRKKERKRVSVVAQWVMNWTSTHEDAGLITGLA